MHDQLGYIGSQYLVLLLFTLTLYTTPKRVSQQSILINCHKLYVDFLGPKTKAIIDEGKGQDTKRYEIDY